MTWLAVAVGGAIGSVARHAVNRASAAHWPSFPAATLIVNLSGCFLIGLLAGAVASQRLELGTHWRELVFVGLLGGFTTFSAFGLDTFVLSRTQYAHAALNVAAHVGGGLVAVWVGYQAGAR